MIPNVSIKVGEKIKTKGLKNTLCKTKKLGEKHRTNDDQNFLFPPIIWGNFGEKMGEK